MSGEGILARKFLKDFILKNHKEKVEIKTLQKSFIYKNNNFFKKKITVINSFFHKYLGPIYGACYLRFNRKKKIIYINYLPLWNFIIFLLLPKKTIIGPITGGVYYDQVTSLNSFIRKYIFPIFYKISVFIIYRKFKRVIFSTDLLKYYIPKSKYRLTLFNFVFSHFSFNNYKKTKVNQNKEFDLIFYNRNHSTKTSVARNNIINFLSKYFKICVIGDFYNNAHVKNFGFVDRNKIYNFLKKSKGAITSEENFFSLFVIDCINCNLKIISFNNRLYNSNLKKNFFFIEKSKNFIFIKNTVNKILNLNFKYNSNFKKYILLYKNKINNFIKS
jgi:hypothetical protein